MDIRYLIIVLDPKNEIGNEISSHIITWKITFTILQRKIMHKVNLKFVIIFPTNPIV